MRENCRASYAGPSKAVENTWNTAWNTRRRFWRRRQPTSPNRTKLNNFWLSAACEGMPLAPRHGHYTSSFLNGRKEPAECLKQHSAAVWLRRVSRRNIRIGVTSTWVLRHSPSKPGNLRVIPEGFWILKGSEGFSGILGACKKPTTNNWGTKTPLSLSNLSV